MPQQRKAGEGMQDALDLLREDHEKVQSLFEEYEETDDNRSKKRIADTILNELIIHTKLEEEIFYPAVREAIDDDDLMDEAEEEHHTAKLLIAELEEMEVGDEHYDAKITVLGESIQHHVKEEESDMFPKVKRSDIDLLDLGEQMTERKQELLENIDSPPPTRGKRSSDRTSSRSR